MLSELVRLLQAEQKYPVPYRPNLMGLVERFNRTWTDMVAMYVGESQNDWDEWLAPCTYAYNVSRHSSTGFAPFQLLYGRQGRTPNQAGKKTCAQSPRTTAS